MNAETLSKLQDMAIKNSAALVWDGAQVAIQRYHYGENGIRQVRLCPENCDFFAPDHWCEMTSAEVKAAIC